MFVTPLGYSLSMVQSMLKMLNLGETLKRQEMLLSSILNPRNTLKYHIQIGTFRR